MDQLCLPSYTLSNLTQMGDAIPLLPLPTLDVPHNTQLLDDRQVAEQVQRTFHMPSAATLQRVNELLASANLDFVKLTPEAASMSQRQPPPSELMKGLTREALMVPKQDKVFSDYVAVPVGRAHPRNGLPPKPLNDLTNHGKAAASPIVLKDLTPIKRVAKRKRPQPQQNTNGEEKVTYKREKKGPIKLRVAAPSTNEDTVEVKEGRRLMTLMSCLVDIGEDIDAPELSSQQGSDLKRSQSVVLNELWSETARLKASGIMSSFPPATLASLVSALDKHLVAGVAKIGDAEDEKGITVVENIFNGFAAAASVMNIITSKDISNTVMVEEVIDNLLTFVKHQLVDNIFPAFDSTYGIENVPPKATKKKNKTSAHNKTLMNNACQLLDLLNEFAAKEALTDTIILELTAINLPTFFVDNVSELQLSALNTIRTLFSRFQKHRTLILDDIFGSLTKLPKTKRGLRNYRLPEDKKSIQMVSALVLQLIQCCPSLVAPSSSGKSIDLDSGVDNTDPNSYPAALTCAHVFMSSLVAKCSSKDEDNDYRVVLMNFLEDLLITLNLPEWPAAEVILHVLVSILLKALTKESKESTLLKGLAIDMIGMIAARVRQEIKLAVEWKEILPQLPESEQGKEDVSCLCKKGRVDENVFWLDCDSCHKWFHGACVGILSEQVPEQWYCDNCLIRKKIAERKSSLHKNSSIDMSVDPNLSGDELLMQDAEASLDTSQDASNEEKEMDVMRQFLLNYLAGRSRAEKSSLYSRQFFICQWYDAFDETDPERAELYKGEWVVPEEKKTLEMKERTEPTLSRDGIMKIIRYLATKAPLFKAFDSMLSRTLVLLNQPLATFRSKALKSLHSILEADASILGEAAVLQAVKSRFWDSSILVRSAAIDLVGQFVVERPEFAQQYYPIIAERIMDLGVSVRKKVVKILRDLCLRQPDLPLVPSICKKLVTRLADEESSIKEMVLSTFQDLWFSELKSDGTAKQTQGLASLSMQSRIDQIVDVVATSATVGSGQWFVELVRQSITGEQKKGIRQVCEKMCSGIVERILNIEEQNAREGKSQKKLAFYIPTVILTLEYFCEAEPALLLPHVSTLHPYLTLQTSEFNELVVIKSAASIIGKVAPLLEHPDPSLLKNLEGNLEKLIYKVPLKDKQSFITVSHCIKCLCSLITHLTHNVAAVRDIFNKFQLYLDRSRKLVDSDSTITPHVVRGLFCMALIARNIDLDEEGQTKVMDALYNQYLAFSASKSPFIRHRAIEGMGNLFIRYPQFLLKPQTSSIIKNALASEDWQMRLQMITNLTDFLIAEEAKMVKQGKPEEKKPAVEEEESDGEANHDTSQLDDLFTEMDHGDSGASSNLMQTHLQTILGQCFDSESSVRSASVYAIDVILHQGLVNPLLCVPHLVALEADREMAVSDKAHRLLATLDQKHPNFLHHRFIDGIKLSYDFQMKAYGNCSALAANDDAGVSVLGKLYTLFNSKRSTRNSFLSSLVKLAEKSALTDIKCVRYIVEILATLPYTVADEPLYIITCLNRTISFVGGNLLSALKALFPPKKKGQTEEVEVNPKAIKEAADKFKSASMIMMLVLLKKMLKRTYGITDKACLSYSTSDNSKAPNKKVDASVLRFTPQTSPFAEVADTLDFNIQQLRDHYQMFKRLIKEDENDFDPLTAKAKPRGGRKKVKSDSEEGGAEPKRKRKAAGADEDNAAASGLPAEARTQPKRSAKRAKSTQQQPDEEEEEEEGGEKAAKPAAKSRATRSKGKEKAAAKGKGKKKQNEDDDYTPSQM